MRKTALKRFRKGLSELSITVLAVLVILTFVLGPLVVNMPELYWIHFTMAFASLIWEMGKG